MHRSDVSERLHAAVTKALILTPLHHCTIISFMRLTVNLESDLYALAKSLAKAEDCSISAAVNRLLRRALPGGNNDERRHTRRSRRNGFIISKGSKPITPDMVRNIEAEDDNP